MRYDKRALKRLMDDRDIPAEMMANQVGVSKQAIYMLYRGVTEPRASTLAKLVTALDVPLDTFFVRKDRNA